MEWFLYDKNLHHERVNRLFTNYESFIPTYQTKYFYTHYYIGVSAYAVVLEYFIRGLTI